MTESIARWFGVRCVLELDPEIEANTDPKVFDERVTVGQVGGIDAAIELAEAEAVERGLLTNPPE